MHFFLHFQRALFLQFNYTLYNNLDSENSDVSLGVHTV